MSDAENTTKRPDDSEADLSVLARDAAHPFDQTNGIIEGLEGNADDPDQVEERLHGEEGAARRLFPGSPGAASENKE
ncbi:hypothetical protein GCM10027568_21920 [Humibacter soli]